MNKLDYVVSTEDGDILIEKDSKRITDGIVDQLIEYRKQLKLTQQDIADAKYEISCSNRMILIQGGLF